MATEQELEQLIAEYDRAARHPREWPHWQEHSRRRAADLRAELQAMRNSRRPSCGFGDQPYTGDW